jgi:hypothetical protein
VVAASDSVHRRALVAAAPAASSAPTTPAVRDSHSQHDGHDDDCGDDQYPCPVHIDASLASVAYPMPLRLFLWVVSA